MDDETCRFIEYVWDRLVIFSKFDPVTTKKYRQNYYSVYASDGVQDPIVAIYNEEPVITTNYDKVKEDVIHLLMRTSLEKKEGKIGKKDNKLVKQFIKNMTEGIFDIDKLGTLPLLIRETKEITPVLKSIMINIIEPSTSVKFVFVPDFFIYKNYHNSYVERGLRDYIVEEAKKLESRFSFLVTQANLEHFIDEKDIYRELGDVLYREYKEFNAFSRCDMCREDADIYVGKAISQAISHNTHS